MTRHSQETTGIPSPRTGTSPATDDLTAQTGRYMYAVCRGLDPTSLVGVRGLGGRPLEFVSHLDLVALVSTVPMSSFGESGLRHNLEDLAWLEATVRIHDDVIHAAALQTTTAPMRLATICYDDDAVRVRLREWYIALTHVLDRVEGCSEWSVKVLAPPTTDSPPATAPDGPVSGAEYLRRKKSAAESRIDTTEAAIAHARIIHDRLAQHARTSRQLPPQDPRLSRHHGTMVLNAAYLVPDAASAGYVDELAAIVAEHTAIVIEGRGPWPPYSFAMLEQR